MNDRVAGYRGLVESIAERLAKGRRAAQVGAEYDDLVQEGLIAVWRALKDGVDPVGPERIADRMRNYMRWLAADTRQPIPYEELLPLNDETAAP
jgi:hypothetical protein